MWNAPERISLLPEHDWSWCEGSPVTEPDRIEYVLADRIEALEAENARLREALQRLRARYRIYAGWPELRRAGKADKLILALADEVLEPSPALKQEGGE